MAKALQRYIYILIALTLALSSCVTSRKTNYLQSPKAGVKSYEQLDSTLLKQEYRLQVGDQVYISIASPNEEAGKIFSSNAAGIMGNAEVVSEMFSYTIYADSCIDFPFVGTIKLAGLTTREAKLMMTEKLQEYVPECDVDLRLTNSYFTFIGQAGTGKYPIARERLTIYQALAISGDLKPSAHNKEKRRQERSQNIRPQKQGYNKLRVLLHKTKRHYICAFVQRAVLRHNVIHQPVVHNNIDIVFRSAHIHT